MKYIYLHGFASSPQSLKAQFFYKKFSELGIELSIPDLNLSDFSNLKISEQLAYLRALMLDDDKYCLIGSSLGGLLALILAEEISIISKLILLAPAIEVKNIWDRELGVDGVKIWQQAGFYNVFHSGIKREIPLSYNFILDMHSIKDRGFARNLPALIIHGKDDQTIPINASYCYQQQNKLANLVTLDCGHGMEDKIDDIWDNVCEFLNKREENNAD